MRVATTAFATTAPAGDFAGVLFLITEAVFFGVLEGVFEGVFAVL